jgi:hypothetical protein
MRGNGRVAEIFVGSVAAAAGENEAGGCDNGVRNKQLQFCWHKFGSRRHYRLDLIIEIISTRRARLSSTAKNRLEASSAEAA